MAAGVVQIPILDGSGVSRQMSFYSSDGTVNGNLTPMPTIFDGSDVALGSTTDTAISNSSSAGTLIAFTKGLVALSAAISSTQLAGTQKTQIVDQSGNIIHSTSNALNVNITGGGFTADFSGPTGAAVPADAGYFGVSVGGTLRGRTGANPSGTVYSAHTDLTSIGGATILTGNGVAAGSLRVSLASDSTGLVALAAGAAVIGSLAANQSTNIAQMNGVAVTMGNGVSGTGVQRVTIASDSTGQIALAAGASIIGKVSIDQTTPGTTNGVQVNAALPAGANVIGALVANQSVNISQMNGVTVTMGNGVSGTGVQRVTLASDSTGQIALAAGAATIGALTANQTVNLAQIAGTATAVNTGDVSAGTIRTTPANSSTGAKTNAAATGSSITILASNTARIGAAIYNESAAVLYLDCTGGTASATSYTVQVSPSGYYEVPSRYRGLITGLCASGTARVTEWT